MHFSIINKIKAEQKAWLLLGVALLLLLCAVWLGMVPQLAAIKVVKQKINSAAATLSQTADPRYKELLIQQHAALTARQAGLNSQPQDLSSALQLLIVNASQADIEFVKMEPQARSVVAGMQGYPVFLQIQTTYHNLGKFISACEAMPQNMRISRLALTAATVGKIDVRILVTCFYQQDKQGTP